MTDTIKNLPFEAPITSMDKGAPWLAAPLPLDQVAAQGWSLLDEDLPLPVALLRTRRLLGNSQWMTDFVADAGARHAPHGKTTMAPALMDLQMQAGAWGMTVANVHQLRVALAGGMSRILIANQVIGRAAIDELAGHLAANPDLEAYVLADNTANVVALQAAMARIAPDRTLIVMVEVGVPGGRCGCRSLDDGLAVARAIRAAPRLGLAGVEAYEGLTANDGSDASLRHVDRHINFILDLAQQCYDDDLFDIGGPVLTAGGSAYYDRVAALLSDRSFAPEASLLLRAGCYLTHDSSLYAKAQQALIARNPRLAMAGTDLEPALEVWGYVISRPEAGKAVVGIGKRDVSHDDPPVALYWARPGEDAAIQDAPEGLRVTGLNDQHCHLQIPEDSPLQVGDMLGFGISHPCLTFDKWRLLFLVDEARNVTGACRTYF